MIESRLANTFVGSEHKSKAFNWHALWERKKEKSCRWSYNYILRCTFKHKTLQDTVSRLLRINRHPFQSDSIFSATFPIVMYRSNFFFLVVHHQQTAKTVIIKPVPLINWPRAKFDSHTLALGGTSDGCVLSWRVSSPFPQQSRRGSDSWSSRYVRENVDTCSQATNLPWAARAGAGAPAPPAALPEPRLTQPKQSKNCLENGCRPKSDLGEREQTYFNQSPLLLSSLVPFQQSNMWNKFYFNSVLFFA